MGISEALTVAFSGILVLATVANAFFACHLWRVNRELRDLQLFLDKQSRNPDLRVFVQNGWDYVGEQIVGDDGPGTQEIVRIFDEWQATLHLWNTGSSTILVTSWELEASPHSNSPRMWSPEGAFPMKPPIPVSAHSIIKLRADISGYHCRAIVFRYSTASTEGRTLKVPLVSRFGFQHSEENRR